MIDIILGLMVCALVVAAAYYFIELTEPRQENQTESNYSKLKLNFKFNLNKIGFIRWLQK